MSERQFQHELIHVLHEIKEALMGANDDALSALQAEVAVLTTDVNALIAAVGSAGPVNSDISAGVAAVTTDLNNLDSAVKAAVPAPVVTDPTVS